jgi:hypothetical protein
MLADAQGARWQGKYGRDPADSDQQRSIVASESEQNTNKLGPGLGLSHEKNLRSMHERCLPPTLAGARRRMELEHQDWAR